MPPAAALDSDYENGIADVLAFLAGDSGVVERHVFLLGKLSGVRRQIDVLVRGTVYGQDGATLVVDAKRWSAPVDVSDVGCFIDLLRDVEADFGLLVTNSGASPGGITRAHREGGVHVDLLPIKELHAWRPPGTFTVAYRVTAEALGEATRALRRAGFRVAHSTQWEPKDDSVTIEIFRHFGSPNPPADLQALTLSSIQDVLTNNGVTGTLIAHGLIVAGGTPSHRWLELTLKGEPLQLKILAATEEEADEHVARIAATHGVQKQDLGYVRPSGWPGTSLFPDWGVGRPMGA